MAATVHPSDQPGRDCLLADLLEMASEPMREAAHVLGADLTPSAAQVLLRATQLNASDGWTTLVSFAIP
eukprot:13022651-Alexandrium_andersonii.AAC.1